MNEAITALGNFTALQPLLTLTQEEALVQTELAHSRSPEAEGAANISARLRRFGVKSEQIASRSFENLELPLRNANILERNRFFGERTFERFQQFYPEGTSSPAPAHLIHVTCTGYVSPSAPQKLVNLRGWNDSTAVTHAYHMGCYAAMPAIRMAEGFVSAQGKAVDIVHTELCGLHLDGSLNAAEQLVVQTLFADGHIKYTATSPRNLEHGYKVQKIQERIVPASFEDMSWIPSTQSMQMTLSREVPAKIGNCLRDFMQSLAGSDLGKLLKTAQFAVHPGGPKIIDAVKEGLELSEDQISASRHILKTRGNMSSATLPHVWQKLLNDGVRGPVVSLAFGPGLTIFGSVFDAF